MDDTKRLNAWVLGGDGRYPHAVRALGAAGLPVKTYGVKTMENDAPSLTEALKGADLAVLPMKPIQDGLLQIGEEAVEAALLPQLLEKHGTLIAGSLPQDLEAWLLARGVRYASVLDLESYQTANAAVTAEGAVSLAMEALGRTLWGAEALIIGWGRIGKLLAQKLQALGARVTVAARGEGRFAAIEAQGLRPEETGVYHHGLRDYDLICNTVPAQVLDAAQGRNIKPGCVLLELASEPGGFHPSLQDSVIIARGLPGKYAPRTAGDQLAAAVLSCLTGEGRRLE